jgi:3-dehydroquinate synthetase
VVTNTTVAPLYLDKVTWALTHNNLNVSVESVILPDGEKYKNMVSSLVFSSVLLCECVSFSVCIDLTDCLTWL